MKRGKSLLSVIPQADGPRRWPAALAALCASTMVGTMPLMARQLYADGMSAPSMLFWRYALALVALGIGAKAMRIGLSAAWRGGAWRMFVLGATLGAAQTLCFWESLKTLETSIAVLLFYTYPVMTLALDRLLFNHPIRPLAVSCIAAILLGPALITLPDLQGGTIDPRGLLWAVPSPLIYAFYLAINSRLLRHYPPLVGAGGLFGGMALTFAVAAALLGLETPTSISTWAILVFIAVGPGALTMSLFAFAVPRLGASGFAILANAELVTVVLIGTLVLGEAVTPARSVGALLIVTGILAFGLSQRTSPRPAESRALPESVTAA